MTFDKSHFMERFKDETKERISEVRVILAEIEKGSEDRTLEEKLKRAVHTGKGSATLLGFKSIAGIFNKVEKGLERFAASGSGWTGERFGVLRRAMDIVNAILESEDGSDEAAKAGKAAEGVMGEIDRAFS